MNPAAPLLLIDVDGVISLFGFDQTEPPRAASTFVDGIPHWISAPPGRCWRACADFECVWCTGWEDRADEHLPRLLGLPVRLGAPDLRRGARRGPHWKLAAIEAYAGPERPVAWIDDAHDATCEALGGRAVRAPRC